ncbi:ferritin-like domain-containing protein [Nitrosomonas sp. wSCUT-2]
MNQLTQTDIRVLHEALDDEYRSWVTYDEVIADFGNIKPFSNIRDAEARHIEALCRLFVHYGLSVPENPWPGKVAHYPDLQAACEAAAAAEITNAAMYDRLLLATQQPKISAVLQNLKTASQNQHLPAFQQCAQSYGNNPRSSYGNRYGKGNCRSGNK